MESPWNSLRHPLVIAHRGGGALGPENTLRSFELAEAAGADVFEADVQPSRDGHIMVIHDPTVDRTSNGTGPVASLTLEEMKRLDFGWRFRLPDAADYSMRGRGIAIPTLGELFDHFPGGTFSIDIRAGDPGFAGEVLRLVAGPGMQGRVIFGSFHHGTTRFLQQAVPPVAVAADTLAALRLLAASSAHLPTRWTPACDAYMLPERRGPLHTVTPSLIRRVHRLDRKVYAWTIDDPVVMRRLLEIGIDGLITNRTDLAVAARREFLEGGGRVER